MDASTQRMLFLGRQAPPKDVDLKLPPGVHASPHHAPVADVHYRLEKHLQITGWRDAGTFEKVQEHYEQVQQERKCDKEKLHAFQRTVKERASRISKEMRMAKLESKRQLEVKQEFWNRRKEYAKRVGAANSNHFKRMKEREEAGSSTDSSDSSEESCSPSPRVRAHDGQNSANSPRFRAPASPRASPSRDYFDSMARCDSGGGGSPAVRVVPGTASAQNAHIQIWRHKPPAGRRLPIPGATPSNAHRPSPNKPEDALTPDEPARPPPHVTAQVSAWHRQQALYKGALEPGVRAGVGDEASDPARCDERSSAPAERPSEVPDATDGLLVWPEHEPRPASAVMPHIRTPSPEALRGNDCSTGCRPSACEGTAMARSPGTSSADVGRQESGCRVAAQPSELQMPARSSFDGVASSPSLSHPAAPPPRPQSALAAQRSAHAAARTRVRAGLLSHHRAAAALCAASQSPEPSPQALPQPQGVGSGAGLALSRVAGGGAGLRGVASASPEAQPTPMADLTNAPAAGFSAPAQTACVPVVHASRSAKVKPERPQPKATATSAAAKLPAAMHARLQAKVAEMGITLPQLCNCHSLSVLDPRYPAHCATNCPMHNNEGAYYVMLHALLHTFGVAV